MQQRKQKMFYMLLTLCMVFSMFLSQPAQTQATGTETENNIEKTSTEKSDDIVILYTNDIHTYIDKDLSYDVIAGLKTYLKSQYEHVLLVDAGDHIQGTVYGSMDNGETIIELMNATGYDLATLGNHEFDYGMDGRIKVTDEWASFPYVSCNFYSEANGVRGDNVLDSYKIFDLGTEKVAIIGITTPESFTKTTPAYFQDNNGSYIYGISSGSDGEALYSDVQNAIDAAKAEDATQIIALGHLGDDLSSAPWTSEETIANVSGLNAFIDGHSHNTVVGKTVQDEDGNDVILTQTGEYFNAIGMMIIDSETGEISTELLGTDHALITASTADETVKKIKQDWVDQIEEDLGITIGTTNVTLDNYNENGNRLVRIQETNSGSFAADALYYLFDDMDMDVDVAIMNGGNIRNTALIGNIDYKTCKLIHTFGNVACLQTITGQQLLDALEWGARQAPTAEVGGFLHVAGITYEVDGSIESTVQSDDKGIWIGGPTGEYRVKNVKVYNKETNTYEDLDLEAKYNLAGHNYTLRDLGDGFAMFEGAVNVLDYVMEDYMVLANYIQGFENATVDAINSPLNEKYPGLNIDYSKVTGDGRIQITASEEKWDGKITIGGLTNNVWFTKYGNVYTDCTADDFVNELCFTWGDMITVKFLDQELTLPVVPDYSYVDTGKPAIILKKTDKGLPTGYVSLAINMGSFGETYGLGIKKTDTDGNWSWEAAEGVEYPVNVTYTLAEKEGYMAEYLLRELTRTNNRDDYTHLSDEAFANFREVTTTGIKENTLFRTSSPINPEIGRNTYSDDALKNTGVTVIMNLADDETTAKSYPDFENTYYSKQKVIYLNLGIDFRSDDFKNGLAKGLRFFAENRGIYAIHCTEGKDRSGFVNALLQCLTGATYDEVISDYMQTYINYYGIEKDSEKYLAIAKSNIIKSLEAAFELNVQTFALAKTSGTNILAEADLAKEAEEYIKSIGLTSQEIIQLKTNLCSEEVSDSETDSAAPETQPDTEPEMKPTETRPVETKPVETKPIETKPEVSPETGDSTPITLMTGILLMSVITLSASCRKTCKK